MPVIPEYSASEKLDTDARGMPRPTFSTAESGAALYEAQQTSRLGGEISAVAQHFQAQQEQKAAFSAGVQDDARRQELTGFFDQAKKNMPEDGSGFHDGFLQKADEIAEKRFAAMPPDQAAKYRERWQAERIGWANKAAETEAATGKQYTTGKIGELQQGLIGEISNNPTPEVADAAYQRGVERIKEAAFLSPSEKASMLKGWEQSARTAEAQTRFAADPVAARAALGVTDPAARGKANFATVERFGDPRAPGWEAKNLTTVTAANGETWRVNKEAATAFDGLLKDLAAEGYEPKSSGGFNYRTIRGSDKLSQHAFGTAIDIGAEANAMGSTKTDLPPNIRELAAKNGLIWGGDWKNRPDPMHFEWAGGGAGPTRVASSATASDAQPEGRGDPRYDAIPFNVKQQIVRSAEQGFNKQKASVAQLMKDDEQSIMETGAPIDTLTPQQVAATHGPDAAQTFIENRRQAVDFHNETKDWEQAPAGHIEESLARLTPQPGQPGYGSQSAYLDVAKKKAAAILKARENDPAAAVEKFPEVKAAAAKVNPQDPETVKELVRARTVAQTSLGLKPMPITNKEAEELGSVLTNALPGTEKRILDKLIPYLDKAYGDSADMVLKRAMDQAGVKAATQDTAAALFRKIHRNDALTATDAQELQGAQTTDAMGAAAGVTPRDMASVQAGNSNLEAAGAKAGTVVGQMAQTVAKQTVGDPKAALSVPDEAIVTLLRNPSRAAQFDETFKLPPGTGSKLIKKHEAMNGAK